MIKSQDLAIFVAMWGTVFSPTSCRAAVAFQEVPEHQGCNMNISNKHSYRIVLFICNMQTTPALVTSKRLGWLTRWVSRGSPRGLVGYRHAMNTNKVRGRIPS